jgi:hypothetical protein
VVDEADSFLEQRRGAVGEAPGDGDLWPRTDASICLEIWKKKGISRRVRIRGGGGDHKEVAGLPGDVGIEPAPWQRGGSPAMNCGSPAAFYKGEEGGYWRGE